MKFAVLAVGAALVTSSPQAQAEDQSYERALKVIEQDVNRLHQGIDRLQQEITYLEDLHRVKVKDTKSVINCANDVTGKTFADKQLYFFDSFPRLKSNGLPNYVGPKDGKQVTGTIYNDVKTAFNMAPYLLRLQLCNLTRLYINQSGVDMFDWGFWENKSQRPMGHARTFVSLAYDWGASGLPNFEDYESNTLNNLVNVKVTFQAMPAGNKYFTLISRLAHEVGHVVWYNEVLPILWTCNGGYFWSDSWDDTVKAGSGFHVLGDTAVISGTQVGGSGIPYNQIDTPQKVYDTYNSRHWASIVAEVAPDEDFAETYRILVLAKSNPSLAHLSTGGAFDVAAEVDGSGSTTSPLGKKAACICKFIGRAIDAGGSC